MKQVSFGIVLSLVAVFVVAILLTVDTRTSRERELENSVDLALSETIDKVSLDSVKGTYSDSDMEELAKEAIKKRVTEAEGDKEFKLDIDILAVDAVEGLISANVKESYTNPNGKPVTIEAKRTIAVESESGKDSVSVSFKYEPSKAQEFDVPELITKYTLCEDENIKIPKEKTFEGYKFSGFKKESDGSILSRDELSKIKLTPDLNGESFILLYEPDGSSDGLVSVRMKTYMAKPNSTDISVHGKEGGSSGSGNYIYKFGYLYCKEHKAIELFVQIYTTDNKPHKSYHFHSANDNFPLSTKNPTLIPGKSLDNALNEMIGNLGITDFDSIGLKKLITDKFKYYNDGRGIWAYPTGENKRYYLVYMTASSILDGVSLTVVPGKGIESTYGSGVYPVGTTVKYGGKALFGYKDPNEKEIVLTENKEVIVDAIPWSHRLHFDANGGENAPDDIIKVFGEIQKIPIQYPTRDNYDFDYYEPINIDVDIKAGDDYTHDQDGGTVTMKAHYKSYITYDTTTGLSSLSGAVSVSSFGADEMKDGGTISVSKRPSISYNGSDVGKSILFVGWNSDPYGRGEWFSHDMNGSSGSFSYGGGHLHLYAQYMLSYDLLYDGNLQTEGENFVETRQDGVLISASGSTFSFAENPFLRILPETHFDDNLKEDVSDFIKYSFQGWSLNDKAYFTDDRVYKCKNENREKGNIKEAGIRDYLSECLITNPCDNISIKDSYITVKTFAVWDRYPSVFGYDIGLTRQEIENISEDDLKALIIEKSRAVSDDLEDSIRPYGVPEIKLLDFNASDFLSDNDFSSATATLMVTDNALNNSYYQINVFVSSENFETSKDKSEKSKIYKRFIDEENYSKSFSSFGTSSESLLSIADRKKANKNGGMEMYSKWILNPTLREKIKSGLS